jgi:hypothetical protein
MLTKYAEWMYKKKRRSLKPTFYLILMDRHENNHNPINTGINTMILFISKSIRIWENNSFLCLLEWKEVLWVFQGWGAAALARDVIWGLERARQVFYHWTISWSKRSFWEACAKVEQRTFQPRWTTWAEAKTSHIPRRASQHEGE